MFKIVGLIKSPERKCLLFHRLAVTCMMENTILARQTIFTIHIEMHNKQPDWVAFYKSLKYFTRIFFQNIGS